MFIRQIPQVEFVLFPDAETCLRAKVASPMRLFLYILGAFFELLGILLIAAPDLVPWAVRALRWLSIRWRPIENRLRTLFGLPPRTITVSAGLTAEFDVAGSASATKSIGADADLEAKVAWLLRRDQEAQEQSNALARRIQKLEAELERRLEEIRAAMETHVTRELEAAQADYRRARIGGTFALILGLALTTWGNFAG